MRLEPFAVRSAARAAGVDVLPQEVPPFAVQEFVMLVPAVGPAEAPPVDDSDTEEFPVTVTVALPLAPRLPVAVTESFDEPLTLTVASVNTPVAASNLFSDTDADCEALPAAAVSVSAPRFTEPEETAVAANYVLAAEAATTAKSWASARCEVMVGIRKRWTDRKQIARQGF